MNRYVIANNTFVIQYNSIMFRECYILNYFFTRRYLAYNNCTTISLLLCGEVCSLISYKATHFTGAFIFYKGFIMYDIILALVVGLITGLIFSFFKLPIPAPNVLPGVIGIFGVYLGNQAYIWISQLLSR